ncbi:hypothetical protein BACI349Y_560051 [Bacillus sp. 349Y]|nr:hypothetical protein BACI349Y_560051 [Bacillus sp. 349Y]
MNGDDNMERMVQDHENRITSLEDSQKETNEAILSIQRENENNRHSMLKLENTVLKANSEQKVILDKLLENVLETNKEEKNRQYHLNKINLTNKWQFALTAISSGGILYVVLQILTR